MGVMLIPPEEAQGLDIRKYAKKRLLDLQRIIHRVFSSKACRKMIKNTILDWDDYREQFDREGAGAHTYYMDFFRDRSKVGKTSGE